MRRGLGGGLAAACSVGLCALALGACGGDDNNDSGGSAGASSPASGNADVLRASTFLQENATGKAGAHRRAEAGGREERLVRLVRRRAAPVPAGR